MADFDGQLIKGKVFQGTFDNDFDGFFIGTRGAAPVTPTFLQRLIDTGLGTYVYFTRESVDPTTPALAPGDTQPNNTGVFDFNTHSILAEV